jgi:hypothetical protein
MPWTGVTGETLRRWRMSRHWDVMQMAKELRAAAGGAGTSLPATAVLAGEIRRWEAGVVPRWPIRWLYLRTFAPERLTAAHGDLLGEAREQMARLPTAAELDTLAEQARISPSRTMTDDQLRQARDAAADALEDAAARFRELAQAIRQEPRP